MNIGGSLRNLSGLDGHSHWTDLHNKTPEVHNVEYTVRKEMVINIDEVLGIGAVRYHNWKLIMGNISKSEEIFNTLKSTKISRVALLRFIRFIKIGHKI